MDREAWYAEVHGVAKSRTWFSDWITSIPLYIYTTSLSIHLLMDIYVAFMSQLLSLMLKWTLIFSNWSFLCFCAQEGDCLIICQIYFKGVSILVSIMAIPIYITNTTWEHSLFSTSSPALICSHFNDSYSDWCEVISYCSFVLCFSNSDIENLFICLLSICMSSLEKCLFSLLPTFWLGFLGLGILICRVVG